MGGLVLAYDHFEGMIAVIEVQRRLGKVFCRTRLVQYLELFASRLVVVKDVEIRELLAIRRHRCTGVRYRWSRGAD